MRCDKNAEDDLGILGDRESFSLIEEVGVPTPCRHLDLSVRDGLSAGTGHDLGGADLGGILLLWINDG